MMKRSVTVARYILAEFGPLIVFWVLAATAGIRIAIAGSIAAIACETGWRLYRGIPFTRLYLLVSFLTVAFGIIDLLAANPFMLKYEAVVTNVATGLAFVLGAGGARPMLQEVVEQRQKTIYPDRADIRRFFQIFTLIWAGYFFIKAGFYFYVGQVLPMVQAMAVRSTVGGISLGVMTVLSFTQGRRLFSLCQWCGWLPVIPEAAELPADVTR